MYPIKTDEGLNLSLNMFIPRSNIINQNEGVVGVDPSYTLLSSPVPGITGASIDTTLTGTLNVEIPGINDNGKDIYIGIFRFDPSMPCSGPPLGGKATVAGGKATFSATLVPGTYYVSAFEDSDKDMATSSGPEPGDTFYTENTPTGHEVQAGGTGSVTLDKAITPTIGMGLPIDTSSSVKVTLNATGGGLPANTMIMLNFIGIDSSKGQMYGRSLRLTSECKKDATLGPITISGLPAGTFTLQASADTDITPGMISPEYMGALMNNGALKEITLASNSTADESGTPIELKSNSLTFRLRTTSGAIPAGTALSICLAGIVSTPGEMAPCFSKKHTTTSPIDSTADTAITINGLPSFGSYMLFVFADTAQGPFDLSCEPGDFTGMLLNTDRTPYAIDFSGTEPPNITSPAVIMTQIPIPPPPGSSSLTVTLKAPVLTASRSHAKAQHTVNLSGKRLFASLIPTAPNQAPFCTSIVFPEGATIASEDTLNVVLPNLPASGTYNLSATIDMNDNGGGCDVGDFTGYLTTMGVPVAITLNNTDAGIVGTMSLIEIQPPPQPGNSSITLKLKAPTEAFEATDKKLYAYLCPTTPGKPGFAAVQTLSGTIKTGGTDVTLTGLPDSGTFNLSFYIDMGTNGLVDPGDYTGMLGMPGPPAQFTLSGVNQNFTAAPVTLQEILPPPVSGDRSLRIKIGTHPAHGAINVTGKTMYITVTQPGGGSPLNMTQALTGSIDTINPIGMIGGTEIILNELPDSGAYHLNFFIDMGGAPGVYDTGDYWGGFPPEIFKDGITDLTATPIILNKSVPAPIPGNKTLQLTLKTQSGNTITATSTCFRILLNHEGGIFPLEVSQEITGTIDENAGLPVSLGGLPDAGNYQIFIHLDMDGNNGTTPGDYICTNVTTLDLSSGNMVVNIGDVVMQQLQ
jgi:hypothetical protein